MDELRGDGLSGLKHPWGKYDSESGTRHHLAHHCADVAACFELLATLPIIRNRLDRAIRHPISDCEIERLAALVFLHDIGKLHPGFQVRGWPGEEWGVAKRGHVREGLELFLATSGSECLPAARHLHADALGSWGVSESLLRAVISHHGRPADAATFNLSDARHLWCARGPYDPARAAKELGALLRHWFPLAFDCRAPAFPQNAPAFEHLVCGLTTLADWLGSDVAWFEHRETLDHDYIRHALKQARQACAIVGLDATRQRANRHWPISFAELTGFTAPNAQQALAGAIDLDAQIVILEAETGSGKTEAALWHYMRLFEAGHVDGLYFAVPTRSAAVQLHGRVVKAAGRVFAQASPQPVLAVPGYIRAGDIAGTALPHWRVLWDDETRAGLDMLAGRWAAEHSKRYLAAQIAVGTVDQVMLGALSVKHAHLRASSLSRSLLVIDEVHASDAYMTLVQKRLLQSHVAIGGYAMLMSATLGSCARASWLGHIAPGLDTAIEVPYPAIWTSKDRSPRSAGSATASPKHVAMEQIATMAPDATAERALAGARQGARVLVIRNTVKRAVETLEAVEAALQPGDERMLFRVGDVATLHHSRFAPADRQRLDAAVEDALRTSKDRVPEGRVVIGTQTLEQSLDIDADLLVTDLCPVDVLLQRIGRLHRHSLARPAGFAAPRCLVLLPERGLEPLLAPSFENGLGAWRSSGGLEGVYRDLSILELTRRLVERHPVWSIPSMNRLLVESAIHPDAIEALHRELGRSWAKYRDDVVGSELAAKSAAQSVLIDRTRPFEALSFPDGAEERVRTRLGEDNVRVALATPHPTGPFGEPVSEVVVPGRWCRNVSVDDSPAEHSRNGRELLITSGGLEVRYNRLGLARVGDEDGGAQPAEGSPD